MQFEGFDWDAGNWPKCGKYGLSREEIEQLFLGGTARIAPDLAHSGPTESRHIAAGRVGQRHIFVAFAWRAGLIRPISARYMHAREVQRYEQAHS